MEWNTQTIKTYDESAQALAEYFKGIGPRVADIERALELAGTVNGARVVEIGCGDGRDAIGIVKRVAWYEGFDPSEGLLKIAREKLPSASFVKADALTYSYHEGIDVIYAFASLLHVPIRDLKRVFEKAAQALRPGGIFYISLKEREAYTEEPKIDEYGKRMFYYYNPEIITREAGSAFTAAYEDHHQVGKTAWFSIALRRN